MPACIRVWLCWRKGCVRVLGGLGVNRMSGGLFRRHCRMPRLYCRCMRVFGNFDGSLDYDCGFGRASRWRGRMFGLCAILRIMVVGGRLGR
jgi:hypothetical protein